MSGTPERRRNRPGINRVPLTPWSVMDDATLSCGNLKPEEVRYNRVYEIRCRTGVLCKLTPSCTVLRLPWRL